jgi:hypothetical protein
VLAGGDLRKGPLLVLALGCAAVVAAAAVWRVTAAVRAVPRAERVEHLMTTVPPRERSLSR